MQLLKPHGGGSGGRGMTASLEDPTQSELDESALCHDISCSAKEKTPTKNKALY